MICERVLHKSGCTTLYTVDATKYVTAQIDATFHEGRRGMGNGHFNFTGINFRMSGS